MNRRQFLNALTGAVVATAASLGARQGFAAGQDHHAPHHQYEMGHTHHATEAHRHDEERHDSHYHHNHDEYVVDDDHYHNCRLTKDIDARTGHHREECQDHDGRWIESLRQRVAVDVQSFPELQADVERVQHLQRQFFVR